MDYVQRAIYKHGHPLDGMMHDKTHLAKGGKTLCGKELNEMWFITGDTSRDKFDVTCSQCKKAASN